MTPYQWFLIGLMASWTPSLVILAVMLSRAGDGDVSMAALDQLDR